MMTRSASASDVRFPFVADRPSIAAGVEVTAPSACGMEAPDQLRKLVAHSIRVIELEARS
jgi:hypothetical protein